MNERKNGLLRLLAVGAIAGVAWFGGACDAVDDLLQANNPEAIREDQLDDPKLANILVNSTIGTFTSMYDDPFIWRGSMFTDEQITGINWEQTARLSQRIVQFNEGDADGMFTAISQARAMADSASGRLRTLLAKPNSDRRLALTLAYAGYSHVIMAEAMCEATIDIGDKIFSPDELMQRALPRFQEAITIATAANAPDVANLARVGAARANLWLGNDAEVMKFAGQVPANFAYWVEYKADTDSENVLFARVTGGNHALGVHPNFLNGPFGTQGIVASQTDPRVQHTTRWTLGHNRLTKLYKPYQSLSYSGFTGKTIAKDGEAAMQLYERGTDIRLASGLEALHHYYEAAGPSGTGPAGSTLDFVNARRAFGNQAPVTLSGDALMAELRQQRGKDLFMGGFRLGDLRRWSKQGVGDFFPTGTHPTEQWGAYGTATCYPLPVEEYEGNPNIRKPR